MIGSTWTDIHWTLETAVQTDTVTGETVQMDPSNLKYRVSAASREDISGPTSLIVDGVGRRHRFSHLQPATWYTFSVSVVTEGAESQPTDINLVTNPSDMPIPLVSRYDTREMAIKFVKDTFHYLNGPVTNYAILVASSQAVCSLQVQSSKNNYRSVLPNRRAILHLLTIRRSAPRMVAMYGLCIRRRPIRTIHSGATTTRQTTCTSLASSRVSSVSCNRTSEQWCTHCPLLCSQRIALLTGLLQWWLGSEHQVRAEATRLHQRAHLHGD